MNKNNKTSNALDSFYQASSDWAYDRYHSQSLWLRRAIILIVVLTFILFFSVISNCLLFPLKQKIPYLYAFNQSTGEVTLLGELKASQVDNNWEMTRFFLNRYVINREMYDADNVQYPYQIAWAMSGDRVRNDYDRVIFSERAPSQVYGKDKFIQIHILSVSKLNSTTASVRFEKLLTDKSSGSKKVSQQQAIIKWQYEIKPQTQEMLDRDPLGFKVTYYQASDVNVNA